MGLDRLSVGVYTEYMKNSLLAGLIASVLLFLVLPTAHVDASGAKLIYVHEGSFVSDYALVQRLDSFYKDELWLVQLGIGCIGLSWGQDKMALWVTNTTFLDGIGDTFYDLSRSYSNSCKVWDAFPIESWQTQLPSYLHSEFLRAVASATD